MSDIRYEDSDIRPGAVGRFALALAISVAVVAAALLGLLVVMRSHEQSKDPPQPPLADRAPDRQPPEPRLQPQPFQALTALRAQESRELVDYGWVDRATGTVHIPIEDAIALYLRRANAPSPAPLASPRVPTDSAPVPPPQGAVP
ncbi:MAG TPA: hypothetical protein VGL15_02540 [Vicinamibacteria bacterium]